MHPYCTQCTLTVHNAPLLCTMHPYCTQCTAQCTFTAHNAPLLHTMHHTMHPYLNRRAQRTLERPWLGQDVSLGVVRNRREPLCRRVHCWSLKKRGVVLALSVSCTNLSVSFIQLELGARNREALLSPVGADVGRGWGCQDGLDRDRSGTQRRPRPPTNLCSGLWVAPPLSSLGAFHILPYPGSHEFSIQVPVRVAITPTRTSPYSGQDHPYSWRAGVGPL